MTTGTVWGLTLFIFGLLLTVGALQLVIATLFPGLVAQATRNLESRAPVRWLFIVMFATLGWIAAGASLAMLGGPFILKIPGAVGAGFMSVILAAGLGAVSLAIGSRLPSPADDGRPWRTLLRGAVATELAYFVPFVGWLFVLPIAATLGVGASLLAVFQASERREARADLGRALPAPEVAETELSEVVIPA